MSATVKDIARQCKVSVGTVSRVLNNKENVARELKDRVLKAIKKLDYDPYKNIPLVNTIRTRNIGIVMPNYNINNNPFYIRALGAVKDEADRMEYTSIIYTQSEFRRLLDRDQLKGKKILQCEGMVFICPDESISDTLHTLAGWDMPCAVVRRRLNIPRVVTVNDDDAKGFDMGLEYLTKLGHTAIAYIGPMGSIFAARLQAYRSRQQATGHYNDKLEFSYPEYFRIDTHTEEISAWLAGLEQDNRFPTAFACHDDESAIEMVRLLTRTGRQVPRDVSVLGFNDNVSAQMCIPGITTVRVPIEEMSRLACKVVLDYLGGYTMSRADITLDNELVIRNSCSSY